MTEWRERDPVVVGGVGGSGTRAVADLLRQNGMFLGADLNASLDNLWFTLLFKRPRWFYRTGRFGTQVGPGLAILAKAMKGRAGFSASEYGYLLRATAEMACFGHDRQGSGRGSWAFARLRTLLRHAQASPASDHAGWGWKEPNSHLFLGSINRAFPGCKYIHVIRHGLDMAFSDNQAQLYNWGRYFEVPLPTTPAGVPKASLDLWIRANTRAIELGERVLPERFLLVSFDNLCQRPKEEISRILKFLGIVPAPAGFDELCAGFRKPEYLGRYRARDLSQFSAEQLRAVRDLGFSIDPPGPGPC